MSSRSNKYTCIIYEESLPVNYLQLLDSMKVPYCISPWHDKDIYEADDPDGTYKKGDLKKNHRHVILLFDSLKSVKQVVELIKPLNGPAYVEPVHSATGMYDYLTHAENPEKTPYDPEDIVTGGGFEKEKFFKVDDPDKKARVKEIYKLIRANEFTEYADLVELIGDGDYDENYLWMTMSLAYAIKSYIDSRRYRAHRLEEKEKNVDEETGEIIEKPTKNKKASSGKLAQREEA